MAGFVNGFPLLLGLHALAVFVLATLVTLATRKIRHAAVAHVLWVVVLLKLLTPSFLPLPVIPTTAMSSLTALLPAETSAGAFSTAPSPALSTDPGSLPQTQAPLPGITASTTTEPPTPHNWHPMLFALLAGALVGTLTILTLTLLRSRRFRLLLGPGEEVPEALKERLQDLAQQVGLKRPPHIRVVRGQISPMVWPRPGKPELILPQKILNSLSPAQLDAVLVHELAHLKRRDHWVRVLELVATALFWWHPVTWWARHNLHRLEERCCDAWVARTLPHSARDYAEGLLKTLEFLADQKRPLPIMASGLNVRHEMKERLTMILTEKTPSALSLWHRGLLATLAVALLVVLPTHADREEKENELQALKEKYAAEEVALERRALELQHEMAEVEAERERLEYEREMRRSDLELETLEADVEQRAARGATTEVELGKLELQYREQEIDLRRRARELSRLHRQEFQPLEREARLAQLERREAALARQSEEDHLAAERHAVAMRERKEKLHKLQASMKEKQAALHQEQIKLRQSTLERRLEIFAQAGREADAEASQRALDQLATEADMMATRLQMETQRRQAEQEFSEARKLLEEAKLKGDRAAAKKQQATLEMIKARQHAAELEARRRHEAAARERMAARLTERAADLRAAYDRSPEEDRVRLEAQLKELESRLEQLNEEN